MNTSKHRKLSLTAFALAAALAWSLPAAAQETAPATAELPTGSSCTPGFSPFPDQGDPIPAQTCGPCLLDFCADFYVGCSFSHCGPNNECCEYTCGCDPSCASAGIPGRVCLPLSLPTHCCDNGIQEDPEDCDDGDLAGETCVSLGFDGGTLACFPSICTFNTSGCFSCDDGVCNPTETCETCPADCEGRSTGKKSERFCCGNGIMESAEEDGTICDGNY